MLAVRLNAVCLLLVLATCAIHLPKRSLDPVMENCSPLCEQETEMEMQCAMSNGCYDVTYEDSDQFVECVKPCWDLVGPCFNLCIASYDVILKQCFNSCSSAADNLTCIQSCYYVLFLALKTDVLYGGLNGTHNSSTTTQDGTDIASNTVSSASDPLPTSNLPIPTNIILAALEINELLQESFTDDVTTEYLAGQSVGDVEKTWRAEDKLNSIELPSLTEHVDDVMSGAREVTTVRESLPLLAVLTGHSPEINYSETLPLSTFDPNNVTEQLAPGERLKDRSFVKTFDDKTLQILMESYEHSTSDYLKFNFNHRKNFSGSLAKNSSQLELLMQATDEPGKINVKKNDLVETEAGQGHGTLAARTITSMGVHGSKRIEERQNYVEMLNRANTKFLHMYGLIGPLPKDKTLEAYVGISKGRADVDQPILIG